MSSSVISAGLDVVAAVVDPKTHADPRRLDEAFAWLRKEDPVARAEIPGFDPFWLVTKHADILAVSKDSKLFPYGGMPPTLISTDALRTMRDSGRPILRTLIHMDEPDHMKYRVITQAWFMPQNVKKLEVRIRELAREAVTRMEELGGACDFYREIALHYPLHVIMEIFGVPREDEPRLQKLTQELFGAADPDLQREGVVATPEELLAQQQAVIEDFFTYFKALIEARRAKPADDVASLIANSKIDGAPISIVDAMSYYVILATAGHDTTSATTGGAVWALAERPDEFAKLKGDLGLIPNLVDESIRWTTPVRHFMRSASATTVLRGRRIAEGDWLMLCYPSGNRDEEVFEDPYEFRLDRNPNNHLAFGFGAHMCLGMHLAKMEMRILWEELMPRLKSLEMAGAAQRAEANFVSGLKKLPIRYRMG